MRQFVLILFFALVSCTSSKLPQIQNPQGRTLESFQFRAAHAVVASPNEEASLAGREILQAGGNAVDAAIAVSFAISVLRPQSTGIGGGGFMLIYLKKENKIVALDFRERAPLQSNPAQYKGDTRLSQTGPLAVATPGLVAGLWEAYQQYGSRQIPWERLLDPAIRLAEGGFAVYPHLAMASEKQHREPLKVGDTWVQADLAQTLRLIAKSGATVFYEGPIADRIADTLAKLGGVLSRRDLREYKVVTREPVQGTFLGYTIASMPPPSSGGIHLIEILNILEQSPLPKKGYGHARTLHWMIEAMRRAYADRAQYLGDPDFVTIPQKGLVSKKYAESLVSGIHPDKATPSAQLMQTLSPSSESDSTAHLSVVDAAGNAATSTQTINTYFGSGITVPGTGIILNNEMDDFALQPGVPNSFGLVGNKANAIEPGKRPLSSMTPVLVFDPKGQLFMAAGSPGGSRIITTMVQVLTNAIAYHASPLASVAAPRMHHQWLPDEVEYEPGAMSDKMTRVLDSMGHTLKRVDLLVTDVQLIQREGKRWVGVSDPRWFGRPAGY